MVVVSLFACICISFMKTTSENYTEFLTAVQGMQGNLVGLEIEGDTVFLTFRFTNESDWDLYLINVQFNLYGNGEFVGNFDMREKILLKTGETEVVVKAEVHPRYIEVVTGQEDTTIESFLVNSAGIHWFIYGAAVIELPLENETRNLDIREEWVSG